MLSIVSQLYNSLSRYQSSIDRQFEPIVRFICFFFDNSHLRDEVPARTGAASGAIVRTD